MSGYWIMHIWTSPIRHWRHFVGFAWCILKIQPTPGKIGCKVWCHTKSEHNALKIWEILQQLAFYKGKNLVFKLQAFILADTVINQTIWLIVNFFHVEISMKYLLLNITKQQSINYQPFKRICNNIINKIFIWLRLTVCINPDKKVVYFINFKSRRIFLKVVISSSLGNWHDMFQEKLSRCLCR